MKKNIANLLREHLNLNLARIKCLSLMITALVEARNIQLSVMARYFSTKNKEESCFRRMQRFIKEVSLSQDSIARLIMAVCNISLKNKLILIIDRTNWQFGKTHINILYLSIVYKSISIPLFFDFLIDKKSGTTSYYDKIKIVKRFIKLFGIDRIKYLVGDREFTGYKWILWLQKKEIPFIMRLPENKIKIAIKDDNFIIASDRFKALKKSKKNI